MQLDWMLVGDSEGRARCYYIANLRRERLWCIRSIAGTEEHAQFAAGFQRSGRPMAPAAPENAARQQPTAVDEALASRENAALNAGFEQFVAKRHFEPSWHQVSDDKSLRAIATSLDRLGLYDVFYARGSEASHASSFGGHLSLDRNHVLVY
jgi:hypothetical protein